MVNDIKWSKPASVTNFTSNSTYDAFGRLITAVDPHASTGYNWHFTGMGGKCIKR